MKRHLASAGKVAAWTYLAVLHLGLAYFALSPEGRAGLYWRFPPREDQTAAWHRMVGAQARLDATVEPGSIVFIGDSGVQSLNVAAISPRSINYGIGGDTTFGVKSRLPHYKSLASAQAVVLLIGSNDLAESDATSTGGRYAELLTALPRGPKLVLIAVLPVDEAIARGTKRTNRAIGELNLLIRRLCENRPSCVVVDAGPELRDGAGNLRRELHVGDGLHLNAAGYRILIGETAAALKPPQG
jgi:lysophospholipase L1-like esterase